MVFVGLILRATRPLLVIGSSPSPTPTPLPSESETAGWETITSKDHGFSIQHPPEVEVQETVDGVHFMLFDSDQEEGEEFLDGVNLIFRSGFLEGRTLEEFAEERREELLEQKVVEEVSDVQRTKLANLTGFNFDVKSLVSITHIYLPRGENQYLEIINATADPNDQGYKRTADKMLSTLKVEREPEDVSAFIFGLSDTRGGLDKPVLFSPILIH